MNSAGSRAFGGAENDVLSMDSEPPARECPDEG